MRCEKTSWRLLAGRQNNLALALASRGSVEEAEKSLESAIRYAPDYFEAHLKLGRFSPRDEPLSGGTAPAESGAKPQSPGAKNSEDVLK